MEKRKSVIHWFRKGLRIHDNPALIAAIDAVQKNKDYVLRPIYILDPEWTQFWRMSANKWRFLHQSLVQLDENLKTLNTRLYVIRGTPKEEFPRLFKEWNVTLMTFEAEIEPFNQRRDALVKVNADKCNVKLEEFHSHTIYNPYYVLQSNNNEVIMRYQSFVSLVERINVQPALEITDKHKMKLEHRPPKDTKEKANASCYDLPELNELPMDESTLGPNKFPGGENEALDRMEKMLSRKEWICDFEKPKTSPNSIEPSTTVLSPYFSFGCLSSRLFYHKLKAILSKKEKHTQPPVSLMGQLMWREFYYAAAAAGPNFDKMVGNKICRQIPWKFDQELLDAWAHGKTGYPFIDAIMRQLRTEGWIHHLARHAVACFLTRGDLWISWEQGQHVFEELLLDADWALNAGNWMWLSASAFFYQYFRVYSPVAFGKKTDPFGNYIRKYCPELKEYPSQFIYEPWKATVGEQRRFHCEIGKDYPKRIVIHEVAQDLNKGRMKRAYDVHNGRRDEGEPSEKVFVKEETHKPLKIEIKQEDSD
ncbi:cryptochrome-2 [Contarinia nasturtii]|uniref:cryptochrome-2 n=1 Tax=Contarinia nasturtii TaxID=265458 RepID=UPI0012D4ACFA|nr:cryptochrome-2 [Contarinia nasturtii]